VVNKLLFLSVTIPVVRSIPVRIEISVAIVPIGVTVVASHGADQLQRQQR
jgi:hypothetical protein